MRLLLEFLIASVVSLSFYGSIGIFVSAENLDPPAKIFTVDFINNTFLMDGEPFRYVSGSVHYFRIPEYYWRDRLMKIKSLGLNTIEFYIPWNYHEFEEGQYNFSGNRNISKFLELTKEIGLYVLLRPGPYICGEWDFGGFPAWLLRKNPYMKLRSSDSEYMAEVTKWFGKLLPIVRPYLYQNNGTIIMVQVENEYGSFFTCDNQYLRQLFDMVQNHLGQYVLLFTTDGYGYSYLTCGSSDRRLFSTVDFGYPTATKPQSAFVSLLKFQPRGPLVNSEYYTGWMDAWGDPHNSLPASHAAAGLRDMLQYQPRVISVNMYLIHGGTSFGFWNGANNPPFLPQVTSYDYDAPITEAGDTTEKYMAIRKVMQEVFPSIKLISIPVNTTKAAYGKIQLTQHLPFLKVMLDASGKTFQLPQTMESLRQYHGYMLYATDTSHFNHSQSTMIRFDRIGDFGYIFTSNENFDSITYCGTVSRTKLVLSLPRLNSRLLVLIENAGHINYGRSMVNDVKGIIGNVSVNGSVLLNWTHIPILPANFSITDKKSISKTDGIDVPTQAGLFLGSFQINDKLPNDTFINLDSDLSKGILVVNGHNMGRYWNRLGPQKTLFVPRPMLRHGANSVAVFELEGTVNNVRNVAIESRDTPILF